MPDLFERVANKKKHVALQIIYSLAKLGRDEVASNQAAIDLYKELLNRDEEWLQEGIKELREQEMARPRLEQRQRLAWESSPVRARYAEVTF